MADKLLTGIIKRRLQCIVIKYAGVNYCRSGNIRENLIFANIRELVASRIQSSR